MRSLLLVLIATSTVLAGITAAQTAEDDQEKAHEAVQRGEILPLETILKRARVAFDGEMLDVELEERHDAFDADLVYEVKMLADDGEVSELYYDARTGDFLEARGHGLEAHHREDGAPDNRGHDDRDEHEGAHDDDNAWDWFGD